MNLGSPFPPLVTDDRRQACSATALDELTRHMSAYYGVEPERLRMVRGVAHGLELVLRSCLGAEEAFAVGEDNQYEDVLRAYKTRLVKIQSGEAPPVGAVCQLISNPKTQDGRAWGLEEIKRLALEIYPTILVVDESYFDVCDAPSASEIAVHLSNVVVLRNLAYLSGEPDCQLGAIISSRQMIQTLCRFSEFTPLSSGTLRQALNWMTPENWPELTRRAATIKSEQSRLRTILDCLPRRVAYHLNDAPFLVFQPNNVLSLQLAFRDINLKTHLISHGLLVPLGEQDHNDLILKTLGISASQSDSRKKRGAISTSRQKPSREQIVKAGHGIRVKLGLRDTHPVEIRTGNGLFDHMMREMASGGEFSLQIILDRSPETAQPAQVLELFSVVLDAFQASLGSMQSNALAVYRSPITGDRIHIHVDTATNPEAITDITFERATIGTFPTDALPQIIADMSRSLSANITLWGDGGDDYEKMTGCFRVVGGALKQLSLSHR